MKRMLAIILSLILSIAIVGCGKETGDENEVGKENPKEVSKAEDKEAKEDLEIEVTFNSTERTTEDKWDELEEGKELILVDITIKNNGDKEYHFNPNYVQINVDGHLVMVTDKSPKDIEAMKSKEILPGEEYTGVIPFEVDEGQEYRKIVYDDFDNQIELD